MSANTGDDGRLRVLALVDRLGTYGGAERLAMLQATETVLHLLDFGTVVL